MLGRSFVLGTAALLVTTHEVDANLWTGSQGSAWSNPNNWVGGVPGVDENADLVRPADPYTNLVSVSLDVDTAVSLGAVFIGDNRGTNVAILTQSDHLLSAGSIVVGHVGAGSYTLGGGGASLGSLWVGSTGDGSFTLGSTASLTSAAGLFIARAGFSGSVQHSGNSFLGQNASISDVALDVGPTGSFLLAGEQSNLKVYASEQISGLFQHTSGVHEADGDVTLTGSYTMDNTGSLDVDGTLSVSGTGSMFIDIPNLTGNGISVGSLAISGNVHQEHGIVGAGFIGIGPTGGDPSASYVVHELSYVSAGSMSISVNGIFTLDHPDSTLTVANAITNGGTFTQVGEVISDSQIHQGGSTYNWMANTLRVNSLTVLQYGDFIIRDSAPAADYPHVFTGTFHNQGLTEWRAYAGPAATPITLSNGSTFYNEMFPTQGEFAINSDSELLGSNALFVNRGKIVKYSGTGTTRIAVPFRSEDGTIEVQSGTIQIDSPLTIASNNSLIKTGTGTLRISGSQSHESGSTLLAQQGTVQLETDAGASAATLSITVASLPGGSDSKVTLTTNQSLKGLSVSFGDSGTQSFDLNTPSDSSAFRSVKIYAGNQNQLDAAKAALYDAMKNANVAGAPDPLDGIYDSGIIYNSNSSPHSHSGVGIAQVTDGSGTYLLIRPTLLGDTNLDGRVTIADYTTLSSNYNNTSGTATWDMGDFNYDGNVTISDNIDLNSNWSQSYSGSVQPIPQSVPEPANFLLILSCGLSIVRRAKHRTPATKR
jgi:autotransporter-associated beta strand protein